MHVVLDTSIYRSDPRREKAAFRAFERLASGAKLHLHVPYFVEREFVTQQTAVLSQKVRDVQSSAGAILRQTESDEFVGFAEIAKQDATVLLAQVPEVASKDFSSWVDKVHGTVHSINPQHGQRVANAYFSGAKPFSGPKHREDIPDSFIWETIVDLSEAHEGLVVVSSDKAIFEAARENPKIVAYQDLDSFTKSAACQAALQLLAAESVKIYMARAVALLEGQEEFIRTTMENGLVDALAGKDVRSHQIPDDNNEASITMVGAPDDLKLDFEQIEYYGETEIGIPFETSVECTLNYAIFKSDYYMLDDDKSEGISIDERNDHYYDADEDYTVNVTGRVLISFNSQDLETEDDLSDEDLIDVIEASSLDVEVSSIEIAGDEE